MASDIGNGIDIPKDQAKRLRAMRVRQRIASLMRGVPWYAWAFGIAAAVLFATPLVWRAAVDQHNRTAGAAALQSLRALRYESADTTGALRLRNTGVQARERHVKHSRWIPRQWELRGTAELWNFDEVDHAEIRTVADLLGAEGRILVTSPASVIDNVRSRADRNVATPKFWATHEQLTAARSVRLRIVNPVAPKAPAAVVAINALAIVITSQRPSLGLKSPGWWAERNPGNGGWRMHCDLHLHNDRARGAEEVTIRARLTDAGGTLLEETAVYCGAIAMHDQWRGSLPPMVLTDARALAAHALHLHVAVK